MTNSIFTQNFDHCKSYKSLETLEKALEKISSNLGLVIPVQIPYGKNQGRFTAIFPAKGGENIHWVHMGFIILG